MLKRFLGGLIHRVGEWLGNIADMIAGFYQWYYAYLTDYMHPYVVSGIMILVSAGIVAISLILLRNVFDRIVKKWHGLWQYYKVTGVKSLRKAVSVDLCIVSMTFALLAVKYSLLDVNVVSWWHWIFYWTKYFVSWLL